MGLGQGILEIAMAALGIAVITLLIGNAAQTVQVAQGVGGVFTDLISTLTLQQRGYGSRYGR